MSKAWDPQTKKWVEEADNAPPRSPARPAELYQAIGCGFEEDIPSNPAEETIEITDASIPLAIEARAQKRAAESMKRLERKYEKSSGGYDIKSVTYKYDEAALLAELKTYIDQTYVTHYGNKDGTQVLDMIIGTDLEVGFLLGNILKYSFRYGKKGTVADQRKDIMKIMHYSVLLLHAHDKGK